MTFAFATLEPFQTNYLRWLTILLNLFELLLMHAIDKSYIWWKHKLPNWWRLCATKLMGWLKLQQWLCLKCSNMSFLKVKTLLYFQDYKSIMNKASSCNQQHLLRKLMFLLFSWLKSVTYFPKTQNYLKSSKIFLIELLTLLSNTTTLYLLQD